MTAIEPYAVERAIPCFNARGIACCEVSMTSSRLVVRHKQGCLAEFLVSSEPEFTLTLLRTADLVPDEVVEVVSAAVEAVLARSPHLERIELIFEAAGQGDREALQSVGIIDLEDGGYRVRPEMFFQTPASWVTAAKSPAFPQFHVMTSGRRHPLRPAKPTGKVYARFIPWLDQVLSFRTVDLERDLDRFHEWMNDPRVAAIWDERGTRDEHRAYLEANRADPHMLGLLGCLGDVPFSYFEVYWAKENRLGPFYDADDYDRGWHVAVGEEAYRGKAFVSAWLPSLMHFMFLDDPRTQRIVGEPAASHAQQIRNLERSGFAKIKHVDFPHKRAVLVMLLREKFFNDRLWVPAQVSDGVRPSDPTSNQTSAARQLVSA